MSNPNVIAEFVDSENDLRAIVSRVPRCPMTGGMDIELRVEQASTRWLHGCTYFDDATDALAYARVCAGEPPL